MKTKIKNIIAKICAITTAFVLVVGAQVFAANDSTMNQAISAGTLDVDIVDGAGATVPSPSVTFNSASFSYGTQDTTGTLGTASQKIRVSNGTNTATWTASIAGNATTDTWTDGGTYSYDFNDGSGYTDGADADSVGGQLTVNPSGGTIVAPDSKCNTTGVSAGTSDSFNQGTTDSIDLMSADGTAKKFCRWDLTGIALTQKLPAMQDASNYTLSLVLSAI